MIIVFNAHRLPSQTLQTYSSQYTMSPFLTLTLMVWSILLLSPLVVKILVRLILLHPPYHKFVHLRLSLSLSLLTMDWDKQCCLILLSLVCVGIYDHCEYDILITWPTVIQNDSCVDDVVMLSEYISCKQLFYSPQSGYIMRAGTKQFILMCIEMII